MFVDIITRLTWKGQPIDALAFKPPHHDGSSAAIAREVYHRLVVQLASIQVYRRQWQFLWLALAWTTGCFFVSLASPSSFFPSGSTFLIGLIADFIGICVFVGGWFALPMLMGGCVTPEMRAEAEGVCRRAFLRNIPDGTPADLRDVWRQGWITSEGWPISSEICEADARSLAARSRALWWIPTLLGLASCITALFSNPLGDFGRIVLLLLIKVVFDKNPGKLRSQELNAQAGVEGVAFAEAGGLAWARRFDRAHKRQLKETMREAGKDPRPTVVFGMATGLFAARGDSFAPTAGLPFSAGLRDLETHVLVLGGVGAGKTSAILRPVGKQIANWREGSQSTGMVILDGKGSLPQEFKEIDDTLEIVDPRQVRVSLVKGLDPVTAIDTIVGLFNKEGQKGDRFFVDSAANLLRKAAAVAYAAGDPWWSLAGIERIATQDDEREAAILSVDDSKLLTDVSFRDASKFFISSWPGTEEKVRSNIIATAISWIATITSSPDLLRWAETTDKTPQVDITSPLRGGRIGILVPAYRYGRGGAIVTALLKARLYAGIKARAEGELGMDQTAVVFIIDEAQEVATEEDATMLAIGRSLRLSVIAATQTVEGVVERLGEPVAKKWFGIFGGLVALPGRSRMTDEFVALRCGSSWRASVQQVNGMSIRTSVQAEMVSGAVAAGRHQSTALKFGDVPKLGSSGVPSWVQTIARLWQGVRGGIAADSTERSTPASTLGVLPLVQAGEVEDLLAEPDTALAVISRGRVVRRDVIRLTPIYPKQKPEVR
jgi:hypothetical protein